MRQVDLSKSVLLRQAVRVRRRAAVERPRQGRRLWPALVIVALPFAIWRLASRDAPTPPAPGPAVELAASVAAAPSVANSTEIDKTDKTDKTTVIAKPLRAASFAKPGLPAALGEPPLATGPAEAAQATAPVAAPLAVPTAAVAAQVVPPAPQPTREIKGVLKDGNTLLAALDRAGLERADRAELLNVAGKVIDFRRCRPGDRYRLILAHNGRTERLEYYGASAQILGATRKGARLVPLRTPLQGERDVRIVHGTLHSSLEAAVVSAGGTAGAAFQLTDLFAWDLDFNVDPQKGDTFSVAQERVRLPDGSWRDGAIVGAEYRGAAGTYQAFRFNTKEGGAGYYDGRGYPLRRRYLASPLPFVRITSNYGTRWHPILSRLKHHGGIDYAAPTGTSVWAVADGKIEHAGRKGGYGNLVVVRHPDGLRTYYGHLSRIAKGLHKGARVAQKDVVGLVGMTGMATGPHLHFGMKSEGKFFDPAKARGKRAAPLAKRYGKEFRRMVTDLEQRFSSVRVAALH